MKIKLKSSFSRPRRRALALWLSLLLCSTAAVAWEMSHQHPPKVAPGQMATPEGKLEAAQAYAEWFLQEDATLKRAFTTRDPRWPTGKGQPIYDCGTRAIVSDYKTGQPYFEGKSQKVAIVPVATELLIVEAYADGGPEEKTMRQGGVGCTFEYERYNTAIKRFEKIPDFGKRLLYDEFRAWGPFLTVKENFHYTVATEPDKSIVRFKFRISVAGDAPYQLEPQFPRHYLVDGAAWRILKAIDDLKTDLNRGISDRDPAAQGKALSDDLKRMETQMHRDVWMLNRIQEHLDYSKQNPVFSKVQP